jgi:threonine dehydratase
MALAFTRLKIVVEPGGAVALAAALFHGEALESDTIVAVTSGGNVDADIFAMALERFG